MIYKAFFAVIVIFSPFLQHAFAKLRGVAAAAVFPPIFYSTYLLHILKT